MFYRLIGYSSKGKMMEIREWDSSDGEYTRTELDLGYNLFDMLKVCNNVSVNQFETIFEAAEYES